jgi:hypothetical protein
MSSPPVPIVSPPQIPKPLTLVCANCHATLAGEYCNACGQRHEPHVHTLAHFAAEALESISHADSRLWRTLWYLLSRPGFLTREFFAGRRVSYLPPFRLYLVISVLFFLVAGVPKDAEILRVEPEATPTAEASRARGDVAFQIDTDKDSNGVSEGVRDFCDQFKAPAPLGNSANNNLRERCRTIATDGGRSLAASIVHNVPRAMFVFLPLIALFMKLLYWRPKRYYVEHLLFLVHNHALVFLVLTAVVLIGRIPHVGAYVGWLWFVAIVYMVWYVFRGMRNYYQQGRARTTMKYLTLGIAYISTSFTVLLLTAIYSAMMA